MEAQQFCEELYVKERPRQATNFLFRNIDDWCYANKWELIDDVLRIFDCAKGGTSLCHSMLVITNVAHRIHAIKNYLEFWHRAFDFTEQERGNAMAERLLRTLHPEELHK